MNIKLLTEYYLEFLSLKGDCTCLSESIYFNVPQFWKSHVVAYVATHLDNDLYVYGNFLPH